MKKFIFLTIFVCLATISAFAQDRQAAADFSGKWTLDTAKSKLDERMRVESMTLGVSQTAAELKVETVTKRAARPTGEMPNGGAGRSGGGGGRMGGNFGGGDGTIVYTLDGKEATSPVGGGASDGTATTKAEFDGAKLKTTTTRKMTTPMGDFTLITKETWELSDGGKILKIIREMETPRGNRTSEMIFTKK